MQPGGELNLQALLQQAQMMQQQLVEAQAELARATVTGSAGGGLVTATVTGTGQLTSLDIDPSVIDPDDAETLSDLIVAAVRNATSEAERLSQEKMGPLAGGLSGLGL